MPRILYTQTQIKHGIRSLFSDRNDRRIAIVGFVGDGAQAYLGNPAGVEIFCWPRGGGTNPNALRLLRRRHAIIRFVDSLHMKLYWSPRGCVITSANLT